MYTLRNRFTKKTPPPHITIRRSMLDKNPNVKSTINIHKRASAVSLTIAIFALCSLAGIVAGTYMQTNNNDTSAAEYDAAVDLAVEVAPVISLTTSASNGTLSIPIIPNSSGASGSNDLTVSVHTNNQTGYKLTMNSTGTDTSLTHQADATQKIPSTTNTLVSPAALANNTWGYSTWTNGQSSASTTFSRIPSLSAPDTLRTTSTLTDPTDTKLTFGARINTEKPSGTYTNTVVFSATSNFVPPFIQYMQDFTASKCNALASGTMVELRDQRDDTVYRVKKMADGNCWMVDNLALDLTQSYTGKPSWATAPVTVSGSTGSVNNVPQQAVNNNTANQGQIPNNGTAKASYLYNWCAALADTSSACASSVAAAQYNTVINGARDTSGTATSQPAVTGICPAPFRLPKGGPEATSGSATSTANEFGKLDIAMGGTGANRTSANTYPLFTGTTAADTNWLGVLSGDYGNGLVYQGSEGLWWSSTAYDATNAYYLYLNSSNTYVDPASNDYKDLGFAVRCVLNPSDPKPTLSSVNTLQAVTKTICDNTAAGAMVSLKDERDGTYYRVKKMADGNCWMVDNLALDLTSSYTGKPSWGTAPITGGDSVETSPKQAVSNNIVGQGQIPNNGTAKASYLYNWCAALADTSSACSASRAAVANNTVINGATVTTGTATSQPEVTGICPAPFRLPKGGPDAATASNPATTANEFGKLDIAMGGTGIGRSSANTYPLFTGTAATNTNWLGVLSGNYGSGLNYQGSNGGWWSSTAYDATNAYYLYLYSSYTDVYPANGNGKLYGFAVRCVL